MSFEVNLTAGLIAGLAAMAPGAIIYAPSVLGNRWMKEIGVKKSDLGKKSDANKAVSMMLIMSLLNGIVASVFVETLQATTLVDALEICLMLGYFLVSASTMLVFFERRSWAWFYISSLNHVLTFAVIGLALGLML
jgi:hypothetical protein